MYYSQKAKQIILNHHDYQLELLDLANGYYLKKLKQR